ncbi:MAG: hypothetical protein HQK59_15230 [Deltaproteobacteria bacterium]|nr:hypothetical protein [Deltaproteobacteria bacterium]
MDDQDQNTYEELLSSFKETICRVVECQYAEDSNKLSGVKKKSKDQISPVDLRRLLIWPAMVILDLASITSEEVYEQLEKMSDPDWMENVDDDQLLDASLRLFSKIASLIMCPITLYSSITRRTTMNSGSS